MRFDEIPSDEGLSSFLETSAAQNDENVILAMILDQIWDLVNKLPEKRKQVLLLRFRDGKSHEEISAELGLSIQTVYNHFQRGKQGLREIINSNVSNKAHIIALLLLVAELDKNIELARF